MAVVRNIRVIRRRLADRRLITATNIRPRPIADIQINMPINTQISVAIFAISLTTRMRHMLMGESGSATTRAATMPIIISIIPGSTDASVAASARAIPGGSKAAAPTASGSTAGFGTSRRGMLLTSMDGCGTRITS